MTFNFVYLTTNLINGKQYVGEHSTDNLDYHKSKNYMGSNVLLKADIKLHGRINFKREILEFFSSKIEAVLAQEKYIKKYKTHETQGGYNINWKGGTTAFGGCSDETKLKIGNSNKGEKNGMWHKKMSETSRLRMSYSHIGNTHSDKTKEKIHNKALGKNNSMFGKPAWDAINKIQKTCEYCGFQTTVGNYGRWHGKNCKHRI